MDRNTGLTSLRPIITGIEHKADTLPFEAFQSTTLRPILKFQHDLILQLFQIGIDKNKALYHSLKKEEKEEFLTKMIQKQVPFRNQLIGSVIGMFTLTEMEEYEKNTSEINKRILTIAKQRILSV